MQLYFYPVGLRRHSRTGGNPDLKAVAIFKDDKRPVIPAQAEIQTFGQWQYLKII